MQNMILRVRTCTTLSEAHATSATRIQQLKRMQTKVKNAPEVSWVSEKKVLKNTESVIATEEKPRKYSDGKVHLVKSKRTGEPAYQIRPVLSAADMYREAKIKGEDNFKNVSVSENQTELTKEEPASIDSSTKSNLTDIVKIVSIMGFVTSFGIIVYGYIS